MNTLRYTVDVFPTGASMWKGIVEMHLCMSVRQSVCNISCPGYYHLTWYKCCRHWNDLHWPWPGCQSQSEGQTRHLKVRVHIIVSALSLTYELKLRWGIYIYINALPITPCTYLLNPKISAIQCEEITNKLYLGNSPDSDEILQYLKPTTRVWGIKRHLYSTRLRIAKYRKVASNEPLSRFYPHIVSYKIK